tara:strand:- start:413 stop:778 length:366 start_codon:yes stop_codon:yes gene_type:complete
VKEQDYGGVGLEDVIKEQQLQHNKLLRQQQELINNIVLIIEHIVQEDLGDLVVVLVAVDLVVAVDMEDLVVQEDLEDLEDLLVVAVVLVKVDLVVHMVTKDLKDMLDQVQLQEVGIIHQVH